MEFEEIFTSPLTTQTTCYSCGKKRLDNATSSASDVALHFATEMHILGVHVPGHQIYSGDSDDVKTVCRSLPRDSAKLDCVGYTDWDGEDEGRTIIRHIEALAFVDPELIENHEEAALSALNLHRPSQVVIEKDDHASAATPNTDGRPNQKRTSITSNVSGATDTVTTAPLGSGSYHRKSQSELSKGSHTTISDAQQSYHSNINIKTDENNKKGKNSATQKSMARLVLRHDAIHLSQALLSGRIKDKDDQNRDYDDDRLYKSQLHRSCFALLDFRPLCPCIARWGERNPIGSNNEIDQNGGSGDNCFVGIWLGSADDATLRLYAPSSNDPQSLTSVVLPEEHFAVDSPVMAIDFCSVRWPNRDEKGWRGNDNAVLPTTTHTLAIACQDGTIQLITWSDPIKSDGTPTPTSDATASDLFGVISSKKVIVDGPLVCLKLDYNESTSLRVIVGSLCGYVCQLIYNNDNRGIPSDSFWEGPYMVVQDLFNSSINIEESVLTVDAWDNYVAVGTQLGRCLLYATSDSENYFLVWQAVLPYPVHGVAIINMRDTEGGRNDTNQQKGEMEPTTMRLAVTTRRSFHIFGATSGWVKRQQKPKMERYSSELALARILKIFEEIREENEASDSMIRKFVSETIEDLMQKIEGYSQSNSEGTSPDQEHIADVVSCTINDIIDRMEEHATSDNTSSIDSYDVESGDKAEIRAPIDPPHWEYSSSDEEVSLTLEKKNSDD